MKKIFGLFYPGKVIECMEKVSFIIVILLFVLLNNSLLAQSTGLSVTKQSDLSFGDIFIGYSAEVLHTDANAAKFVVGHNLRGNKKALISFNLPANLSSWFDSVPVVFDQVHSAYSKTDAANSATNFNPLSPLQVKFKRDEKLYIWLGGMINSTSGSSSGTYQGTIVITVEII